MLLTTNASPVQQHRRASGSCCSQEGVGAASSVLLTTHASPVQQHRQGIGSCCSQGRRRCSIRKCCFTTHASPVQQHRPRIIGVAVNNEGIIGTASGVAAHTAGAGERSGGAAEPGPGLDRHLRDYHAIAPESGAPRCEPRLSELEAGRAQALHAMRKGPRTRAKGEGRPEQKRQKDLARRLEGQWLRRLTSRTLARGPT